MNLAQRGVQILDMFHHLVVRDEFKRFVGEGYAAASAHLAHAIAQKSQRLSVSPIDGRSAVEDVSTPHIKPLGETGINDCACSTAVIEYWSPMTQGEIKYVAVGHAERN
jgi:hypothetical protein